MSEWPRCECGCGEPAPASDRTDAPRGYVKGAPMRFVRNHGPGRKRDYEVDGNGCWVWAKYVADHGYGLSKTGGATGRTVLAHRLYYERHVGPIPEGTEIDHLCRNRACVNPAHLEAVPRVVNLRRGRGTKLTEGAVREIRQRVEAGDRVVDVARAHGVQTATIYSILRGDSWREVA